MSKGLGAVERGILDALPKWPRGSSTWQLCQAIYGTEPDRSQRNAVQRAVRGLKRKGLVSTRGSAGRPGERSYTRGVAVAHVGDDCQGCSDGLPLVAGAHITQQKVDLIHGQEVVRPKPLEGSPELEELRAIYLRKTGNVATHI
ncbi:hypothetical protein [Streptomyces sp. AcH 505]|uniref:hypothetical protein n=1 Tax=Streptomyces sp. AcH 505 TaxID=352211 RepID=UPI0012FF3CE5